MTIKTLKAYAKRNNYKFDMLGNYNEKGDKFTETGILIHHDYNGEYPTKEAFEIHNKLFKYGHKNGLEVQQRGYYTGTALLIRG